MKGFYRCTALAAALIMCAGMATADMAAKKNSAGHNPPSPSTLLLDCSGATPISCGDALAGDNTGGPLNVDAYACVPWSLTGPEAVFELTLAAETEVTITMTGMSADLDLVLLGSCDEGDCLAYSGSVSDESITECLPAGTYYIVADGYGGAVSSFTMSVACSPCSGPCAATNQTCSTAHLVPCGGYVDNTCNDTAVDTYQEDTCTPYGTTGQDLVYQLDLSGGENVHIEWTATAGDASLYIITDCLDPIGSCVAGVDDTFSGDTETLDWVAPGPGTYYVIADQWITTVGGPATMVINYDCPTGTEDATWGGVKGLFR